MHINLKMFKETLYAGFQKTKPVSAVAETRKRVALVSVPKTGLLGGQKTGDVQRAIFDRKERLYLAPQ